MREIKFRVWDCERKEMILDRIEYELRCLESEPTITNSIISPIYSDRFFLMQYTGLKDKNGTEIYEGDILQGYGNLVEVVEFDNGMFVTKYDALMWSLRENDPVVIGNIYQNSELLE